VSDVRVRLQAQLLSGSPAADVVTVVRHLLAIQAQDLIGARLTVRARSHGLVAGDVDACLNDGSVVVSWLNRGTLHLVAAEDYPWLHALTTPQFATSNQTRLRQEGVSVDQSNRGVAVVSEALTAGPLTRARLREALASAGVPVGGQAVPHLLMLATIRGVCVRGPVVGREHAFVLVADWLPGAEPVSREEALVVLGRRYVAAHRPAAAPDLAKWAGIPLGMARRALAEVTHVPPAVPAAEVPGPRLLGPFDELLMGWASRDWVLDGHADVVTRNGIFRPVILTNGRVSGTWRRSGPAVALEPFGEIAPEHVAAAAAECDDVRRFLS
jgi:hypothetical protein